MGDPIERARALRELHRRTTSRGEALAAARALARLIQRERIDVAQLEADGHAPKTGPQLFEVPLFTYRRREAWKIDLAMSLCRHHGVACFQRTWSTGLRELKMCGRPDDVAIVREMFAWLVDETVHLCKLECEGARNTTRRSWRLGFVAGIDSQLRAVRTETMPETDTRALSLLRDRESEAQAELDRLVGKLPKKKFRGVELEPSAYLDGHRLGATIHLGDRIDDPANDPTTDDPSRRR